MFYLLMRFFGLWGILDALWLAINPHAWNDFWQKRLQQLSGRDFLSRTIAVGQFMVGLWLLKKPRS